MPYKIALTSSDGKNIDLHFGHAENFLIAEVDEQQGSWKILESRALPHEADNCSAANANCSASTGCTGHGHQDGRLLSVISAISDCTYILTAKIGPKPHSVLQKAGITALEAPLDIAEALPKLNTYHLKYFKGREQHDGH
jgi:predicted Fe-Mo cluster-binding NifX family protein